MGDEPNCTIRHSRGANVPSRSRLKHLIPLLYSTLELKFSLSSCSLLSHFHPSFFPLFIFSLCFSFLSYYLTKDQQATFPVYDTRMKKTFTLKIKSPSSFSEQGRERKRNYNVILRCFRIVAISTLLNWS